MGARARNQIPERARINRRKTPGMQLPPAHTQTVIKLQPQRRVWMDGGRRGGSL